MGGHALLLGLSRTAVLRRRVGSVGGNRKKTKKAARIAQPHQNMFLGKDVGGIDSSAVTEGEAGSAFGGAEVVFWQW